MKIISKYHDYYDTARCYTFCADSEAIFVREEIEPKDAFELVEYTWSTWSRKDFDVVLFGNPYRLSDDPLCVFEFVGFCGKIYPVAHVSVRASPFGREDKYFYDAQSLIEFIRSKKKDKAFKKLNKGLDSKKAKKRDRYTLTECIEKSFPRMQEIANDSKILQDAFLDMGIPYYVCKIVRGYRDYGIYGNALLKDVEFYKVFQPMLAYQEIEMFFNSVLVGEANPPQITDNKVILEAKGFDNKVSFRHRK